MSIVTQNLEDEIEVARRDYDTAGIRHLSIEEQTLFRKRMVKAWLKLCEGSLTAKAAKVIGIPYSTLNRWRKQPEPKSTRPHTVRSREDQGLYDKLKEIVLSIRKKWQAWGGVKIQRFLKLQGITASSAMICRMISELIREKQIKSYYGSKFAKKRSKSDHSSRPHAIPRPEEGLPSETPGELVQIDTLFINVDGKNQFVYQINAICCYTKLTYCHTFRSISAKNARYLLKKLIRQAPFKVRAVQTDRGSEFRAEFEQACKDLGITHYVNDPHSPTQNAFVERFNKTVRDEFYSREDLPFNDLKRLNRRLDSYSKFYKTKRPHQGINNLTPMMHYENYLTSQDQANSLSK